MEWVNEELDLRTIKAVSKATVSRPQTQQGITITHIPARHAKAIKSTTGYERWQKRARASGNTVGFGPVPMPLRGISAVFGRVDYS
jgi:hypothetical protein